MSWWEVRCTVPWESAETVSAVLLEWPEIQGVTMEGGPKERVKNPEFGEWMDELLTDKETTEITVYIPDYVSSENIRSRIAKGLEHVENAGVSVGDARSDVRITKVDESSWENAWKDGFQPLAVGEKLMVVPKWWEDTVDLQDRLPVILEPGMAFGTGTHATTQLCLQALEKTPIQDASVLDVGCGTAVLAIASAKLGAKSVVAIDIDPVAVEAARTNVEDNRVADVIRVEQGDLLSPKLDAEYDVVVANILRDIVIRLMPQAAEKLTAGGHIVLSGFVTTQEEAILDSMAKHGFEFVHRFTQEDWVAIMGRKTH